MSGRVRLVIGPDERWPDVELARDTGQKRMTDDRVIEVDEETATRWEQGIAAYDALVADEADEANEAGEPG